jgi:hypothetical protein
MKHDYSTIGEGQDRHIWSVVGPKGAVHVWARANHDEWIAEFGEHWIGGVERHSPVPVYSFNDPDKPDHPDCFLLNGPCWHDGTSLYFSERIAPMLPPEAPFPEYVHSFVRNVLDDFYESHFGASEAAE